MNVLVLLRKQVGDMRWSLGIPAVAFFGLTFLIAYIAERAERTLAELTTDPGKLGRRLGLFRALGGPEQDFSSLALQVCWWNHPVIILTVVGWAIARGSAAVAGEIDRGTMDLTLSRPVSRATYLGAQIMASIVGLLVLVMALAVGTYIAGKVFPLKSPPSLVALLRPGSLVFMLGLSIFAYTLPFSAMDSVRWRPGVISLGITLAGLIAMSLAPQFEGYDWLGRFSVFRAYAPVTVAVKGEPLAYNSVVLLCVFIAGLIPAYTVFLRRDLPAGAG